MILAHEGYHFFSVEGEVKGVCLGVCDIYGEKAPAGIWWSSVVEIDIKAEEKNAWIFSLVLTTLISGLLIKTKHF